MDSPRLCSWIPSDLGQVCAEGRSRRGVCSLCVSCWSMGPGQHDWWTPNKDSTSFVRSGMGGAPITRHGLEGSASRGSGSEGLSFEGAPPCSSEEVRYLVGPTEDGIYHKRDCQFGPGPLGGSSMGLPQKFLPGAGMRKQRRLRANARERGRMLALNLAFDRLRSVMPAFEHERKLSKSETLQMAKIYICTLKGVLLKSGRSEDVQAAQSREKDPAPTTS